ncbi:MAG: deoxyribodipyrimidine photolyase, partial [Gemmatimonadetes bacterium]|nr:deoxyribodipyrimidine photolyase [Gemmatimonadota bacterium]
MTSPLPAHLAERVRMLTDRPAAGGGSYVLYWMHHAVRGHENPALDVAVSMGNRLGAPVLVYQGLGGPHRYNADRHHTFIMQGARDVQHELDERGITYAFHLGRDPDATTPLHVLADAATLVVTEDFPAPPFPEWTRRLARSVRPPVWAVDSRCIVPMQSLGKSFARAFQFRKATNHAFAERVHRPWTPVDPESPPYDGELDFQAIDFRTADLAALCAACEIDHAIGPVPHTVGGSVAGYQRWETFRQRGLKSYARLR